MNAYPDGRLADMLDRKAGRELQSRLHRLPLEEAAVLALLYHGLQRDRRMARVS